MRIDAVYLMISTAIGLVLSYGLWSMADVLATHIAIGSAIYLCVTLGMTVGVRHDSPRTRTNVCFLSGASFLLGLVLNVIFALAGNNPTVYIVVSSISFFVYLGALQFIISAQQ